MRILCIADVPSRALWDYYDETRLEGIDLILSAGDLPAEYLSFLVTFAKCPLLYVHGNHDDRYARKPPDGCECIDDRIYVHEGLRILGLGGSMRYSEGVHQYTEEQMRRRAWKMKWKIWRHRGFDLLLTHAPAKGMGDLPDLPHMGFSCFQTMMDRYRPGYMVHGHVHMSYARGVERVTRYNDTSIINAYERYVLEI